MPMPKWCLAHMSSGAPANADEFGETATTVPKDVLCLSKLPQMCTHVCAHVCKRAYACVYTHVYGHISLSTCLCYALCTCL